MRRPPPPPPPPPAAAAAAALSHAAHLPLLLSGVGFGAIGSARGASFGGAVSLALGIGIQNFPEGLAVSLPLMREGVSPLRAFWYGQLSGIVEPLGGVLGAAFVHYCRPMLPFTMSLAAGAMIFVVCDSLVPEMQARRETRLGHGAPAAHRHIALTPRPSLATGARQQGARDAGADARLRRDDDPRREPRLRRAALCVIILLGGDPRSAATTSRRRRSSPTARAS